MDTEGVLDERVEESHGDDEDLALGSESEVFEDCKDLLVDLKMEIDMDTEPAPPEPDEDPLSAILNTKHSKMFHNCIFCFNLLPLAVEPDTDPDPENPENISHSPNSRDNPDDHELDDRAFEIIEKYLQVKLEDTYQTFIEREELPSTSSPFCVNCMKIIGSLLQLDEKLSMIQTQISSRIEFLTSNILQSKDKEMEFLQTQVTCGQGQENLDPVSEPPTMAAGKVFNDLRKKVLNRKWTISLVVVKLIL